MRSVVVVLPASMCAMMPMLRVSSMGTVRATVVAPLPPVMGKGAVGLGHAVHILALLDGPAAVVGRVHQLVGQLLHHRVPARARAYWISQRTASDCRR